MFISQELVHIDAFPFISFIFGIHWWARQRWNESNIFFLSLSTHVALQFQVYILLFRRLALWKCITSRLAPLSDVISLFFTRFSVSFFRFIFANILCTPFRNSRHCVGVFVSRLLSCRHPASLRRTLGTVILFLLLRIWDNLSFCDSIHLLFITFVSLMSLFAGFFFFHFLVSGFHTLCRAGLRNIFFSG